MYTNNMILPPKLVGYAKNCKKKFMELNNKNL